jgi:hypothetical protein
VQTLTLSVLQQRFANSSCPVRTHYVSFVRNYVGRCHSHWMGSIAG